MTDQQHHSQTIRTLLGGNRIVPVVRIDDASKAPELAAALKRGGISVIEITFRTDAAEDAIRRCRAAQPDVIVGAGTVRTVDQVDRAVAAGAQFLVAPGLSPAIVQRARSLGVPHVPGAITPSEVEQAVSHGLGTLKFFPAEQAGGTSFLAALSAVYPEISFMPTGGVTAETVASYLKLSNVIACGGSWMVKPDWIAAGDFDAIEAAARSAVAACGA